MAVVTKYGRSFKDPASIALPPAAFAEGRVRCIVTGPIEITNGDSATSRHYFGKVPSNAIILPQSTLYHGSATGVNDYDIGLEVGGQIIDADALADGLNLTSAGSKSVVAVLATGAIGKQLWEVVASVANYTRDPAVEFDIVGTLKAAASATVPIEAFIYYSRK